MAFATRAHYFRRYWSTDNADNWIRTSTAFSKAQVTPDYMGSAVATLVATGMFHTADAARLTPGSCGTVFSGSQKKINTSILLLRSMRQLKTLPWPPSNALTFAPSRGKLLPVVPVACYTCCSSNVDAVPPSTIIVTFVLQWIVVLPAYRYFGSKVRVVSS